MVRRRREWDFRVRPMSSFAIARRTANAVVVSTTRKPASWYRSLDREQAELNLCACLKCEEEIIRRLDRRGQAALPGWTGRAQLVLRSRGGCRRSGQKAVPTARCFVPKTSSLEASLSRRKELAASYILGAGIPVTEAQRGISGKPFAFGAVVGGVVRLAAPSSFCTHGGKSMPCASHDCPCGGPFLRAPRSHVSQRLRLCERSCSSISFSTLNPCKGGTRKHVHPRTAGGRHCRTNRAARD